VDSITSFDNQGVLRKLSEYARVSSEDMMLLYLRYYEEMTLDQIATRLGCSIFRVRSHVESVIQRLRDARKILEME
jgi:DNA-directed RNA polymerase specialized sigma24 family protein